LNAALARDQAAGLKIQELDEEVQKVLARVKVADDQISGLAKGSSELARVLLLL
jgi:hypothetical protein